MSKSIELVVAFLDNSETTRIRMNGILVGEIIATENWDKTKNVKIKIISGNYSKLIASFNNIEGNYRKYLTNYLDGFINVLNIEGVAYLNGDIENKLEKIACYLILAKEKMLTYKKKYYHIQRLFNVDSKHIYDVRPV